MVYEIELDMNGSVDYMYLIEPWINRGLKITRYVHEGPGGGNPCITFETPDRALAMQLLEWYCPDEDEDELFESYVRVK